MTTKADFERLCELADMPSDKLIRETKRSAVFLNGRVKDWYCGADEGLAERFYDLEGCGASLDIDKRTPVVVDIEASAPNCKPIGCRVTLCPDCAEYVGEHTRQEVKRFVLDANPTRHDADHVPSENQTMIPGTRPDPSNVMTVKMEVW